MKKGFTLIELLAVIVILAIISLIATPIVLSIIEDAKKNSMVQTVNGIIDAAEYYYANQMLSDGKLKENVIFTFPNEIEGLEFDGEIPKEGFIEITTNGKVIVGVKNGKQCITKRADDIKITSTEEDECVFPDFVNGIMSSSNKCIINGTCDNGTLVKVQVNSEENYNFYTIKDENNELTLIMDRNLGGRVDWINADDYSEANKDDNTSCAHISCTDEGPLTALKALKERTNDWVYIDERVYTVKDTGGYNRYGEITNKMRARLITRPELVALNCNSTCPDYLSINLVNTGDNSVMGYWTTSVYVSYAQSAWAQYSNQGLWSFEVANQYSAGVRPVINISK